jgi:alpha-tubulin suppressor-like RCC1 family protein
VGSESTWSKIANGDVYSVALKSDGSLWAWGRNLWGNIGNGTSGNNYSVPQQVGNLNNWRSISARNFSTYAVKQDGSLWSWGYGEQGQLGDGQSGGSYATSSPQQVGTLTNWKTVTGGYQYAMAVTWPTAPNS